MGGKRHERKAPNFGRVPGARVGAWLNADWRVPGARVGAWLNADADTVRLFGYGVYVGDEVPTADAGGLAPLAHETGTTNPKIVLDSGKVVWGAECWWGAESVMREKIGGRTVIEVDVDEVRQSTAK